MSSTLPRQLRCKGVLFSAFLCVLLGGSISTTAPSLDEALAEVDSLRSKGQFQTAVSHLDSLARAYPDTIVVQWRQALLLADRGKRADQPDRKIALYERSLRAAHTALALDSTNAWAHLTTALAQGRLSLHVGTSERIRRSRSVKRHADRALRIDSTLAPAYHLRGRWHRQVADLNLIERALVKGLYGGLPDASFQQSVWNFKQAIALESKPYNHLELAKTYLAMDRPSAARPQLRRCLSTSGSPFDAEYKREARSLLENIGE